MRQPPRTITQPLKTSPRLRRRPRKSRPQRLERCLQEMEAPQDNGLRAMVVGFLEDLLERWSRSLQNDTVDATINMWNTPRPVIVALGSFRLGVHSTSSDLDLLCLAPPHCDREAFFESFVNFLGQNENVGHVHALPEAYTPVLKIQVTTPCGDPTSVDLLFARLQQERKLMSFHQQRLKHTVASADNTNPSRLEYTIDDTDLVGQDLPGLLSLNGARVAQFLLKYVPDLRKYQKVLRAVKLWAVARGIYGNVLGFAGGVQYAILVAIICQQHPDMPPRKLFQNFFDTFSGWNWPTMPVQLVDEMQAPPGVLHVKPYARTPRECMVILTPVYPTHNTAYNVGLPQLRRFTEELTRARRLLNDTSRANPYVALFRTTDESASLYVRVQVISTSVSHHVTHFRAVESRLRLLTMLLDTDRTLVRPTSHHHFVSDQETHHYVGVQIAEDHDRASLLLLASEWIRQLDDDKVTVDVVDQLPVVPPSDESSVDSGFSLFTPPNTPVRKRCKSDAATAASDTSDASSSSHSHRTAFQ